MIAETFAASQTGEAYIATGAFQDTWSRRECLGHKKTVSIKCRRLNIPVCESLGSVLPGLANFPINRIAELTPTAWGARSLLAVEIPGRRRGEQIQVNSYPPLAASH